MEPGEALQPETPDTERNRYFIAEELVDEKHPGHSWAKLMQEEGMLDTVGGDFTKRLFMEGIQKYRAGLAMQQEGLAMIQRSCVGGDMADFALFLREQMKEMVNPDPTQILADTFVLREQPKRKMSKVKSEIKMEVEEEGEGEGEGEEGSGAPTAKKVKLEDEFKPSRDPHTLRYKCFMCNYDHVSYDVVLTHIQKVHKKIKLSCEFCKFEASCSSTLRSHMRNIHKAGNRKAIAELRAKIEAEMVGTGEKSEEQGEGECEQQGSNE